MLNFGGALSFYLRYDAGVPEHNAIIYSPRFSMGARCDYPEVHRSVFFWPPIAFGMRHKTGLLCLSLHLRYPMTNRVGSKTPQNDD